MFSLVVQFFLPILRKVPISFYLCRRYNQLSTVMKNLLPLLCAAVLLTACHNTPKAEATQEIDADTIPVDAEQYVRMETSEGTIVFRLYRETPMHRHNFVKLCRRGYYDGQTFYRLVRHSLVQAGDPASKTATKTTPLGTGDVDYVLEPELMPERYYHHSGALSMASYRPMKESSGGQFFIVTGFKHNDVKLDNAEQHLNKKLREEVFDSITKQPSYQKRLKEYKARDNKRGIWEVKEEIKAATDEVMAARNPFKYSKEQRKDYTTRGGEASLDGFYTTFGEVIEGMDVVEKIENRAVNADKRPYDDVRIISAVEIDKPE